MTSGWLKRISAALALCLMLGTATACTGGEAASGETAEGTAEGTGEAQTSEPEEEVIKVGYIFNSEVDGAGYAADANSQRLAASTHSRVESYYIDGVNITDFNAAVKKLQDAGCTYIISGSWVYCNALSSMAGKNMELNFISHGSRSRSVNISAYTDQMYEGAYVAGMAAAYNSENERVGIVVDPSMLYTKPVINAAVIGARLVYQDAEVVTAFATADGEIENAVDALYKNGCDVIISYTESPKTVEYCNSRGIKVIGNLDYSQTSGQYENLLMYFYADHNSYYLAQFKQMQLDTWEPQEYVGTIANGGVAVSAALPAAKAGTSDIIAALLPKIANGTAQIFSGELKNTAGNVVIQQGSFMTANEIYEMDWYVKGVNNNLESFVIPRSDLDTNELVIES